MTFRTLSFELVGLVLLRLEGMFGGDGRFDIAPWALLAHDRWNAPCPSSIAINNLFRNMSFVE